MIPLRDVIPSRTVPFVTITFIVLNAAAWMLELSMPPRELNQFLFAWGVVPANVHPATLVNDVVDIIYSFSFNGTIFEDYTVSSIF